MLAAVSLALAFSAPQLSRPALVGRAAQPVMAGTYYNIDPDGEYKRPAAKKPPVKVLSRVESLGVLSSLSEAGVLSAAESAGVFSKLEATGSFSKLEKLLPLADKLKLLSTAESLLNVPSSNLLLLAVALVAGEAGLVYALPDDNAALVAVQAVSGAAVGVGAVVLVAVSSLFGLLQSEN